MQYRGQPPYVYRKNPLPIPRLRQEELFCNAEWTKACPLPSLDRVRTLTWNQDEFDVFGAQRRDHDKRYEDGRAGLDGAKRSWSSVDEFDVDDEFFHLHGVIGDPKSGAKLVREAKALARELNADVNDAGTGFLVCRPTRKEAEGYLQYDAQDNADCKATDEQPQKFRDEVSPRLVGHGIRTGHSMNRTTFASFIAVLLIAAVLGGGNLK